jgi:ketosteroid isomerase-like protein
VVCPALILSIAGCTGSSGHPSSAGSPAATERRAALPTAAAGVCEGAEIKAAIRSFFDAWDHRDAAALGRLFTADGVLDMATKHQDTIAGQGWASAGGRGVIAAFAERQWRLGEKLSYHGMTMFGDGGYAGSVVASFADGTVQPMDEAKFAYGCASHAFAHVVIVSAKAAAPA